LGDVGGVQNLKQR